jgi:glycine/D-amino acid oxidase-like deaminating enzyme
VPGDFAVVGAGIVGSAIALELARRGARVTLLDAGGERASDSCFGWINATWRLRDDAVRLHHHAIGAWRRWAETLPGLAVPGPAPRWTGALIWWPGVGALDAFVEGHAALGHDLRLAFRTEIRRLVPALADPPRRAALVAADGVVDAARAADVLRAAAFAAGARLIGAPVVSVTPGVVQLADGDLVVAERIVVAAGVGTAALLDLPVGAVPALMARTTPLRARIGPVLVPPGLLLHQDAAGRVLCAGDIEGSPVDREPAAIAADLAARVGALVGERDLGIERIVLGRRPVPRDERPIIGPMSGRGPGWDGVYVAVARAGVTLAPGIAELVAGELADGGTAPLLAPFRPERFRR